MDGAYFIRTIKWMELILIRTIKWMELILIRTTKWSAFWTEQSNWWSSFWIESYGWSWFWLEQSNGWSLTSNLSNDTQLQSCITMFSLPSMIHVYHMTGYDKTGSRQQKKGNAISRDEFCRKKRSGTNTISKYSLLMGILFMLDLQIWGTKPKL